MITKSKSSKKRPSKHRKQLKHKLLLDVGNPKVPLPKICQQKSGEKLEDWIDAP